MYNVIDARKTKRGVSHVIVTPDGETKTQSYVAIRAGLAWPVGSLPAHFCILAEEHIYLDRNEQRDQRGRIHLLSEQEYQGMSIDAMFARLTDDCARLYCGCIYTDTVEEYQDYIEAYTQYIYDKKIKIGNLEQAPFANSFYTGTGLIYDWIKNGRLVLPEKSIAKEQLKRISKQELDDKPEEKFNAINALRHSVGAFHKFPPVRHSGAWKKRRRSAMAI